MSTLIREQAAADPPSRRRSRAGRAWLALLILLLAAGAVWLFVLRKPAGTPATTAGRHGGDAIPVLVAAAETRDVPIYLDGLGTVQASQTVTVKPQVDGKLIDVLFREGQDVKKGDVLAHIDPRTFQATLDQAIGKKQQDAANLANAKLDLARYQKLAATAYTSLQTSDTQRALVAQLEAQVAQDQASIDSARAQLSYTTITAPIDGRTGIRQVDEGNIVHAADTTGIVVVTTLQPISVVFTLPQQQLPQVTTAMGGGAPEALALPQDVAMRPNAPVIDRGTLAVLDNQVDPTTGTIKLKALFPNPRLALWPGAFATVRLHVRTDSGATVVPQAAVQRGPNGAYVYVVGDDLLAVRRAVRVGHEDISGSIIEDGLKPGERVVVDGAARLTDKAKVTIAEAPGATPAPGAPVHRRAATSGAP